MLPYGVDLEGKRLYLAGHGDRTAPSNFQWDDCFRTFDLTNPYAPVAESLQHLPSVPTGLSISRGIAYSGSF
jgi:hypothetical protein